MAVSPVLPAGRHPLEVVVDDEGPDDAKEKGIGVAICTRNSSRTAAVEIRTSDVFESLVFFLNFEFHFARGKLG